MITILAAASATPQLPSRCTYKSNSQWPLTLRLRSLKFKHSRCTYGMNGTLSSYHFHKPAWAHTEFCLPSRETTKPHGPFYGWGVKTECAKCFDWQEKGEHSTQCNLLSQTVPTPLNEALLWNECVTLSLHLHAAGDAENVYMFFFLHSVLPVLHCWNFSY